MKDVSILTRNGLILDPDPSGQTETVYLDSFTSFLM